MSVIQIGLVDITQRVNPDLVQAAAAALNIQVTRDLTQFWNVRATVRYLPDSRKIPSGVWPVRLVDQLPPGEGGFHLDVRNQPYAEVIARPDDDGWTIAASHETLEMLVDPYGNRLQSSISIEVVGGKIQDSNGQFEYLVEACDPCEADTYGYSVQGVAVSDFLTPHYYDSIATPGTRYSFTGAIEKPRQILPGGYISWLDPDRGEWQQLRYTDPKKNPVVVDLGPARGKSLREWIHTTNRDAGLTTTGRLSTDGGDRPLLQRGKAHRETLDRIAATQARFYDAQSASLGRERR